MPASSPQTALIECPHCATRYQVAPDMLGPKGRRVTCAHCGKTWKASPIAPEPEPEPEQMFSPADEEALDAALAAAEKASRPAARPSHIDMLLVDASTPPEIRRSIEQIKAALAPRPSPEPEPQPEQPAAETPSAAQKRIAKAFERRLRYLTRNLPTSRIRRGLRIAGLTLLAALLVVGFGFRTQVVRAIPQMAGVYAAMGLGANVVGLDFSDVSTLLSRRNGADVLSVDAKIHSVESRLVPVPPIVVTLTDGDGKPIYQWSVAPDAGELKPGETLDFSTQLTTPPAGARSVRLSFSNQAGRPAPVAAAKPE
jgi:predicted Zn finger-like uncharacterized protein